MEAVARGGGDKGSALNSSQGRGLCEPMGEVCGLKAAGSGLGGSRNPAVPCRANQCEEAGGC